MHGPRAVEVSTADGQVSGRLRGRERVEIRIAPGFAERHGDQDTGTCLSQVARQLSDACSDAYAGSGHRALEAPRDAAHERLAVEVTSRDGSVGVSCVGLRLWTFSVVPGTADTLGSAGIAAAATEAVNDLVAKLERAVRDLRRRSSPPRGPVA